MQMPIACRRHVCRRFCSPCPPLAAYSLFSQSQALLDGDDEEGEAVVAAARASIVYKLTATEVESAADVNKAIIQLQLLRIVSEARSLHWPKLSARAPFTGMSCRLLSDLLVIHTKVCGTKIHQHCS